MGWAVRPSVAGVAARLRLRLGLRPTLRLRRAATPLEYRCQGDTSISANRVTFLLLDNKKLPWLRITDFKQLNFNMWFVAQHIVNLLWTRIPQEVDE